MLNEQLLYLMSALFLVGPVSILLYRRNLSAFRMIVLLFVLDTVLTIEAAFYADVTLIAVLHVITIPAFIVLIYVDLVNQSNTEFKCFICERRILSDEKSETISRLEQRKPVKVLIHSKCIEPGRRTKKAISGRLFRKGIPE